MTVEVLETTTDCTVKVADAVSFGLIEVSFPVATMFPVCPPWTVILAVKEPEALACAGPPEMVTEEDEKLTVTLALNPVPVTVTTVPGSPLSGFSEIEGLMVVVVVLCARVRGVPKARQASANRTINAGLFNGTMVYSPEVYWPARNMKHNTVPSNTMVNCCYFGESLARGLGKTPDASRIRRIAARARTPVPETGLPKTTCGIGAIMTAIASMNAAKPTPDE